MKHIIYSLFISAILALSASAASNEDKLKAELRKLESMQEVLQEKGLWRFLDDAAVNHWSVPWIRSEYWVSRLPKIPEIRVEVERTKRSLGLSLLQAVDKEAVRLVSVRAESTDREREAKRLLDAASWLRQSRGYGNLLLASRVENLACVPLGYLVADLSCSTNKIDALMLRLSTSEDDLAFRLGVIDEESPIALDLPRGQAAKAANDELELVWNRGHLRMIDWCKKEGKRRARDKQSRNKLPDEHSFFSDDEANQPPYTTANKWDQKQHRAFCVYGGDQNIRKQIDTLYLFRRKVQGFPTNPPTWFGPEEMIYTSIQAAFTEAWEPYRKEHGPIGNFAAQIYESISSGELMDWDTAQILEHAK